MTELLEIGARQVIYVSCEPKSLTRDLDKLTQQGYRVTHVQPFDMFPQTEEVETVVKLEK
jgi:tRNA (uracil-5-)-methyltransferase